MMKGIHEFLDTKFKPLEGFMLVVGLFAIAGLINVFFSSWFSTIFGSLILLLGIYGFVRARFKKKKEMPKWFPSGGGPN